MSETDSQDAERTEALRAAAERGDVGPGGGTAGPDADSGGLLPDAGGSNTGGEHKTDPDVSGESTDPE
jgi:hypothetical protein